MRARVRGESKENRDLATIDPEQVAALTSPDRSEARGGRFPPRPLSNQVPNSITSELSGVLTRSGGGCPGAMRASLCLGATILGKGEGVFLSCLTM
jgi:hypothetical protein